MNKSLAPIILFVYNRPWHTEETLEALMNNELANQSTLYIYCDGPKADASEEYLNKIKEVRNLIRKKNWCKEVVIIERDSNLGLANSVIKGVSEVIERHGKVIVLEDDILTGKYFLKFMNDGLEIYENDELVYGVSGYCFPHSKKNQEKTYFLPIMSSWGYGTWKNRWNKINFSGEELLNEVVSEKLVNQLDFGEIQFYRMLQDQVSGKNDSWAVRFYVSMYLNNGVFLYPNSALLKNIGFDGSGVHCTFDSSKIHEGPFDNNIDIPVKREKVEVKRKISQNFLDKDKIKEKKIRRIGRKFRRLIAPEIIQLLKRKSNILKKETKVLEIPRYTKTSVQLEGRRIYIPDIASFRFMHKEIFEQEIYKFKTSTLEPYIIDGGANIGLATIYFKKLYPLSKIVCFEPDPEIFKTLKQNIGVFNFRQIELIQKGLWNANSKLFFKSEGADAGLIAEIDKNNSTPESEIEVVSLKPYLQQPVDFLKLDIEGAETVVLRDIQDDLGNIKRIFVEYHSFVGQSQTLNEIIEILTKAKFRLHISSPGLASISPFMNLNVYNNMDMQLNIYGYKEN
ncbi:FkbM family methyltransferase [Gillisia sp. Q332]|uniref:FkbM family methyltransferase n=1 Tax=Gillisia xinjiangensis TaxID=3384765 RepID=UPI003918ACF3